MTEKVIETLEVRHDIEVLLVTAWDGVTALETASTLIPIPTRDMAKIQTAVKKMREATVYIEDRVHNIPGKSTATTKSALKDALKGASQEQIDRAYAILSGQETAEDTRATDDIVAEKIGRLPDYSENGQAEVPEGGDEE